MRSNGRVVVVVAVATLVVLAGCASVTPDSGEPDGECPTPTAYEQKPLPDRPATVTEETAAEFAAAHANATAWNENTGRAETALSTNTNGEVVNRTETGFVVHVSGGVTYRTCTRGQTAVADGGLRANYFVNETLVARLDTPENETANPLTNGGDVVAKWTE